MSVFAATPRRARRVLVAVTLAAVPCAALTGAAAPASAVTPLLRNGSFETPAVAAGSTHVAPGARLGAWTATGAAPSSGVDLFHQAGAANGAQFVQLGDMGGVCQFVPGLTKGASYVLQLSMAGGGVTRSVRVSVSGVAVAVLSVKSAGFVVRKTTLTAPGTSLKLCLSNPASFANPNVDDVRLTPA